MCARCSERLNDNFGDSEKEIGDMNLSRQIKRAQMFEWCACGQGLSQSALSVDTSCPALSSFCLWGLASFYHVYRCWPMLYIILHHLTSKYPQLRGVIISNTLLSGGIICAAWGRLIPHPSSPACSSKLWAKLVAWAVLQLVRFFCHIGAWAPL